MNKKETEEVKTFLQSQGINGFVYKRYIQGNDHDALTYGIAIKDKEIDYDGMEKLLEDGMGTNYGIVEDNKDDARSTEAKGVPNESEQRQHRVTLMIF